MIHSLSISDYSMQGEWILIDFVLPFEKTGSLLKSAEVVRRQDFIRVLKTLSFGTQMLNPVDKAKLRKSIEHKTYTPIPGGGWSCTIKSKYSTSSVTGLSTSRDRHNGKQRAFENALNKLYEYEAYALGSRIEYHDRLIGQYLHYRYRSID